jgi:hypothetical protein
MSARAALVRLSGALALASSAACTVPTIQSSPLHGTPSAPGPAGYAIRTQLSGGSRTGGELLAVTDSGLMMIVSGRVAYVPRASITTLSGGWANFRWNNSAPWSDVATRLRPISRYPQGISPALQRALLMAYGQTSIDLIPR